MSDDNDFFGNVFDDPEDDPLLGGEDSPADESGTEAPDRQGPPSWMEEDRTNGEADSPGSGEEASPTQKRIVVDHGPTGEGIDELNRAVGQGWRLVRISLARTDGQEVSSEREPHRFVATLEQENPQSLFDFDATG